MSEEGLPNRHMTRTWRVVGRVICIIFHRDFDAFEQHISKRMSEYNQTLLRISKREAGETISLKKRRR